MSSSSDEFIISTPPEVSEAAKNATLSLLPEKSNDRYLQAYQNFITWKTSKYANSFSENVFLAYFMELSQKYKSSSLWCYYSMLKSTVRTKHGIDIKSYSNLQAFLKRRSESHVSRKSKVFSADNVKNFLKEAPDCKYLATKRLEQFEKAISCYDEALRWFPDDVRALLGRSRARNKATEYYGALVDVAQASELEPDNITAKQIRAQTEYEKCSFGKSLVLAHRGRRIRRYPPDFAETVRHAEETIRECTSKSASKMLSASIDICRQLEIKRESLDAQAPINPQRISRMKLQPTHQVQELSRMEKTRSDHISRLMASEYLERMAHDKYFLKALCKDERVASANKQGSLLIQKLANKGQADLEKRQAVLRERRPLYAARAAGAAARSRLANARKERVTHAQTQHVKDAQRLIKVVQNYAEQHDTLKCIENAEFAMMQISKVAANLLPGREKILNELYDIVADAFLDQKRVTTQMSESEREKRASILLGIMLFPENSESAFFPHPPLDAKNRLRLLERAFLQSARAPERCYVLHELSRLCADTKQIQRAKFYASKCQTEARSAGHHAWLLNSTFLLARCNVLQNNRPEAKSLLLEGAGLAKSYDQPDISAFFETCATVSIELEAPTTDESVEQREKAMVSLMQDDDLRSAAQHLFKRMSVLPAARRFSVMPGTRAEQSASSTSPGRRQSIMPYAQQPTRIAYKQKKVLGFQDFDI